MQRANDNHSIFYTKAVYFCFKKNEWVDLPRLEQKAFGMFIDKKNEYLYVLIEKAKGSQAITCQRLLISNPTGWQTIEKVDQQSKRETAFPEVVGKDLVVLPCHSLPYDLK